MVYRSVFPDSRPAPQIGNSAEYQQRGDIGSVPPFAAEPAVLRTDYIAHFNDSVRQDLYGKFDRRGDPGADEESPMKAGRPGIAPASRKIEPGAAVLALDTSRTLAERTGVPASASVLPLVQPSGPSGPAVVTSVQEFPALPRIKTGLLLLHLLGLVLGVGTAKELNFTVSALAILIAYSAALALAVLGNHVFCAWLASRTPSGLENTTSRSAGPATRQSTRGAIPAAEGVPATGPLLASS